MIEGNQNMQELRSFLVARFPLCFAEHGQKKRPLALGIHEQLAAARLPGISISQLSAFLHWYTDHIAYVKAVAAGGMRVNLDGSVAGTVDVTAMSQARAAIAKRDRLERDRDKLKAAEALLRDIREAVLPARADLTERIDSWLGAR